MMGVRFFEIAIPLVVCDQRFISPSVHCLLELGPIRTAMRSEPSEAVNGA